MYLVLIKEIRMPTKTSWQYMKLAPKPGRVGKMPSKMFNRGTKLTRHFVAHHQWGTVRGNGGQKRSVAHPTWLGFVP